MLNNVKGANNQELKQDLVDAGKEALGLARSFLQYREWDDACEMYDDAFRIFAVNLGETHPLTLEAQHEYSMLLTVQRMRVQNLRRRMN